MDKGALESSDRYGLYLVAGIVGFLATVLLLNPGRYTTGAGPLRFDAYYAAAYGFFFMVVVALYYRLTASEE